MDSGVSKQPVAPQDLMQIVRTPVVCTLRLRIQYMWIWQGSVLYSWLMVNPRMPIYLCFSLNLSKSLEKGGTLQAGNDLLWLKETESICPCRTISQFSHSALIIQKKKKRENSFKMELFQKELWIMEHVVIIIIYIIKKCSDQLTINNLPSIRHSAKCLMNIF